MFEEGFYHLAGRWREIVRDFFGAYCWHLGCLGVLNRHTERFENVEFNAYTVPALAKLTAMSSGLGVFNSRLDQTAVAPWKSLDISQGRG